MNIFFIMNDSMRPDHMGCYGNDWIKTPNLDKFAAESALFSEAHSEGLPTVPYRTSAFTGRFTLPFRGWQRLEHTDIVLAEVLWDKGYNTAFISDTFHMHKPTMAFERGFDYVKWVRGHEADPYILDTSIDVTPDLYYKDNGKDKKVRQQMEQYLRNRHTWKSDEDTLIAQVVKEGMSWIDMQARRDNMVLWLDCFDPHEPWDPMPPFDKMYMDPDYKGMHLTQPIPGWTKDYLTEDEIKCVRSLYAGKVSQCDKWVGIFLDHLKKLGLYDNSLIIFNADHGQPLNEHGYMRKAFPTPYIEETQVPLIIRHPEGIGAGKKFDCFVNTPELMPTMLDFLSVKGPRMHGESLLPIMTGEKEMIRDFAISGYYKQSWRIMTKEWSFNHYMNQKKYSDELFDRINDHAELKNVIEENPDVRNELELKLRRFMGSLR